MKNINAAGEVINKLSTFKNLQRLEYFVTQDTECYNSIKELLKNDILTISSVEFSQKLEKWIDDDDEISKAKKIVISQNISLLIEELNKEEENKEEEKEEEKEGEEQKNESSESSSGDEDEEDEDEEEDDEGGSTWKKLFTKIKEPLKEDSFVPEVESAMAAIVEGNKSLKNLNTFKNNAHSKIKAGISFVKAKVKQGFELLEVERYWKMFIDKVVKQNPLLNFIRKSIKTISYFIVSSFLGLYAIYRILKNPNRLLRVFGLGGSEDE